MSRASAIGCYDTFHVAFMMFYFSKYFEIFSIISSLAFLKQVVREEFSVSRFRFCQQIPSADSFSKFLLSADWFFVSKCLCRRHENDAHACMFSFAPACFFSEKFSPSDGAHFASIIIPFVLPDLPDIECTTYAKQI
jgi:hypothetical protein